MSQITDKNEAFEIILPVNYEVAKFLSKSLPNTKVCEFMGINNDIQYTLFNLYDKLSPHLKLKGKAKYYEVSDKLKEALSLPNNSEFSKATIINYLMLYAKKNNLSDSVNWHKIFYNSTLKKLFPTKPPGTGRLYSHRRRQKCTHLNLFEIDYEPHLKNHSSPTYFNIYKLSKKLSCFLGLSENIEINNVTVLQKILEYIKVNNLQNPNNKIEFIPDDALIGLLNTNEEQFTNDDGDGMEEQFTNDDGDVMPLSYKNKCKPVECLCGCFTPPTYQASITPTIISNNLAAFLGKPNGTKLARTEVTCEINAYIRKHHLKDPQNVSKIIPDEKLRKLLGLTKDDDLTYFNLQKYMSPHFYKST